jgi:hypothetical protein
MKYNSIYNNFSAGELSRSFFGKTDVEEYFKGVAEMTNFLPNRQGGASFRPGTIKVDTLNYTRAGVLFPFSPRDNEKYGIFLVPGLPAQIYDTNAGAITINQSPYIWNRRIDFTDASTAWTSVTDTHDHILKVDSLQIASTGDVMIIVDGTGELAPIVIIRTSPGVFYIDSLIYPSLVNALPFLTPPNTFFRVPYKDPNLNNNKRLKPSATTGNITITAQDSTAAPIPFFTGDVVGTYVKITHIAPTAGTGVAIITSKVSDSVVNATVVLNFGGTTAETVFETSYWNPVDGYPKSVCFFEGRLVFGGNNRYPDMIWLSNTGNIYQFMQRKLSQDKTADNSGYGFYGDVKATDPFNFIPAAVGANTIQWLHPADSLLVGTTENEFAISGGQDSALSLAALFSRNISSHGSSKVQPVKIGSSIVFVSLDGKRLLEIPKKLADYTSATDWTGIAAGIVEKSIPAFTGAASLFTSLRSKISRIAWDEPNGILWCITKNTRFTYDVSNSSTSLISLTFDRTSKVIAWAKHNLAGTPFISSIASIPDIANPGMYRIYINLKRSGALKYSLESISYKELSSSIIPSYSNGTGTIAPLSIYMDGSAYGITQIGVTTEIGAPSSNYFDAFPIGSTFGVIRVDGSVGTYIGSFVESGGKLQIPNVDPLKPYIIGLLYQGEIVTMPIEAGAQFGVAQGSLRRTHEMSVYVDRSIGGTYKASKALNTFPIVGNKGTPSALYTGEVKLSVNASPDDTQIVIKQTDPYPFTIQWLLTKGYTYDA